MTAVARSASCTPQRVAAVTTACPFRCSKISSAMPQISQYRPNVTEPRRSRAMSGSRQSCIAVSVHRLAGAAIASHPSTARPCVSHQVACQFSGLLVSFPVSFSFRLPVVGVDPSGRSDPKREQARREACDKYARPSTAGSRVQPAGLRDVVWPELLASDVSLGANVSSHTAGELQVRSHHHNDPADRAKQHGPQDCVLRTWRLPMDLRFNKGEPPPHGDRKHAPK